MCSSVVLADDLDSLHASLSEIQQKFSSSLLHNVRFTPELYQLVSAEAEAAEATHRPLDLNSLLAALMAARAARGPSGPPGAGRTDELAKKTQEQINQAHAEAERLRKSAAFCESRLTGLPTAPS